MQFNFPDFPNEGNNVKKHEPLQNPKKKMKYKTNQTNETKNKTNQTKQIKTKQNKSQTKPITKTP